MKTENKTLKDGSTFTHEVYEKADLVALLESNSPLALSVFNGHLRHHDFSTAARQVADTGKIAGKKVEQDSEGVFRLNGEFTPGQRGGEFNKAERAQIEAIVAAFVKRGMEEPEAREIAESTIRDQKAG